MLLEHDNIDIIISSYTYLHCMNHDNFPVSNVSCFPPFFLQNSFHEKYSMGLTLNAFTFLVVTLQPSARDLPFSAMVIRENSMTCMEMNQRGLRLRLLIEDIIITTVSTMKQEGLMVRLKTLLHLSVCN